jgi:hypothetical protein
MIEAGKILVALGLVLVVAGAVLLLSARAGLPLGRLPGDLRWQGRSFSVYFPLASSALLSIVLSLLFLLLSRLRR